MWGDYPSFEKKYIPVPNFQPFGDDKAPNEGTVKFSVQFGAIFPSPRK